MKKLTALLFGSVVTVALMASAVTSSADTGRGHSSGNKVLEFDTMVAVAGPFVGAANPIRGINGGGLPWQIDEAKGDLRSNGKVDVRVEGLVLLNAAPVPEALRGTNPAPAFQVIVSCLSATDSGVATVNVATNPFPATPDGDSRIRDRVTLPSPCVAPIIFVGPSPTTWFSATGLG